MRRKLLANSKVRSNEVIGMKSKSARDLLGSGSCGQDLNRNWRRYLNLRARWRMRTSINRVNACGGAANGGRHSSSSFIAIHRYQRKLIMDDE
ncbi:hypothetical protein EVAR_62059_1 [Eumeta japonica]|uniref:Uncharacterized protein n=1 Tax=Eumeta variegata TaxID=151549 RepID=A0A4C1YSP3_EUMVA|nr:hypothetical protein EVAR_62059_1 [Eumeta japonica]